MKIALASTMMVLSIMWTPSIASAAPDGTINAPPYDDDGSFVVTWGAPATEPCSELDTHCKSTVLGYTLEIGSDSVWSTLYEGAEQQFQTNALSAGYYQFRVTAHTLKCIGPSSLSWESWGCDSSDSTPVDVKNYTVGPDSTAVGPASAFVISQIDGQLGCQPAEGIDACAQRYIAQTVLGPVSGPAGCYPGENVAACVQRRAAEIEGNILALLSNTEQQAHDQARSELGCQTGETDDQCAARVANGEVTYIDGVAVSTAGQALALIAGTQKLADDTVRQALGCQTGEGDDACAERVAMYIATGAVMAADAAQRQQLQCYPGETTDACRQRRVNETVQQINAAVDQAHQQARTTIGCQAAESDNQCATRVGNQTVGFATTTALGTANQVIATIQGAEAQAEAAARTELQCQTSESDEQCAVRYVGNAPDSVLHAVVTIVDELLSRLGLTPTYMQVRQMSPTLDSMITTWETPQ